MADSNTFGIAGLLGWPVAHSRSPVIHNHWLARYGIAGRYVLFGVPPEKLEAAVRGIAVLGLRGCNVTTPHKQAIFPMLDRVDDLARRIGAINTVVVEQDASLSGFNNDGNGFVQSVRDAVPGWRPDTGPIVIVGAGGAARAIIASLQAQGAREIRIVNRTRSRADELRDRFGPPLVVVDWAQRNEAQDGVALLVNATNQGMTGKPPLDVTLDALPREASVADVIYVPRETPLLAAARARGNRTVNGLGMLLNQARPAFDAWYGVMPEITPELIRAIEATF
ncbi:MAG TPA: shikimate dehydrogenase [Casimicrobiaceae bacterium]|jgi:shikimate dehydrogenase|nr:shikimate dehydrogenase [Casimicrobiaceae bacterium]